MYATDTDWTAPYKPRDLFDISSKPEPYVGLISVLTFMFPDAQSQ